MGVECPEGGMGVRCSNAGTVARFLTAYCAQREGLEVTITGGERLKQRPISQLVDALRSVGADIAYTEKEGALPIRIRGRKLALDKPITMPLRLQSTQFVSALLLIGAEVQTESQSPYISLTREVINRFREGSLQTLDEVEPDWSSAAFWLERQALGLVDDVRFEGLDMCSGQGDRVAVELFGKIRERSLDRWDFASCPDLYPAAAVCCHLLGLHPVFTGLETLPHKESDRLKAVAHNLRLIDDYYSPAAPCPSWGKDAEGRKGASLRLPSFSDHRIAMAFLAAGFPVDDTACISKSYPAFLSQLLGCERLVALREGSPAPVFRDGLITRIQPDGGLGKKHALLEGMRALTSEFVWLTDADAVLPDQLPAALPDADLIILPLRMRAASEKPSLLERLQLLEYDAIQALTMREARRGRAVMCAGANLIVRRSAWLECAEDIRMDIPSGDDMFILEAMKKRGKRVVAGDPAWAATLTAVPEWRAFLRQRMRWAGKAPAFRDRDILRRGLLTALSNLLVVVLPGWFFVKWIADMLLISRHRKEMALPPVGWKGWGLGAILTLLYPFYMLLCLVGGLFRRHSW